MNIFESELYLNDFNKVVLNNNHWNLLKGKSFFITGCNGLICSALVDLLIYVDKKLSLNITLYLASRNIELSKKRFSYTNSSIYFIDYEACEKINFEKSVDYFIHGASPASPELFVNKPVETMLSNIQGIKEILEKSIQNKARVLYISSSEVYGYLQNNKPISEDEYGTIDILNPRSSYSESKRAAETLCISFYKQFNADVVVARPGHIYGPTAKKNDIRVSSSFMYEAINGRNIILKSQGKQLRSYTYCIDCASAIIYILLFGKTGEAYNISNKNSICSISELAKIISDKSNVNLKFDIPKETEKQSFNPMMNSSLSSLKLESLGWNALFSCEEGIQHSIDILRQIEK